MTITVDNDKENDILTIIFRERGARKEVFHKLKEEMFNDPINREIFKKCKKVFEEKGFVSIGLVAEEFEHNENVRDRLEDIRILCEYSGVVEVQLFPMCADLQKKYFDKLIKTCGLDEAKKVIIESEEISFEKDPIRHISEIDLPMKEKVKNKNKNTIFTLYPSLDNIIGGLDECEIMTIGANPATGKSAFAVNLARNFCMQFKKVLYISLEMSEEQLTNRFICIEKKIDAHKAKSKNFTDEELELYTQGEKELVQWDLWLKTRASKMGQVQSFTIEKVAETIQNAIKEHQIDIVIIDYLSLIEYKGHLSEYERLSRHSTQLKRIANDNKIAIINLVQLNKDNEKRAKTRPTEFNTTKELEEAIEAGRPTITDIGGSLQIARDSDYVLLLYKPNLFFYQARDERLEVLVEKNRHGETKKKLTFCFNTKSQEIKDDLSFLTKEEREEFLSTPA